MNGLQGIINSILGFGLDFLTGNVGGELGDLQQLGTNFENLLKLLANPNLLDPNFVTNLLTYAENFVQDILKPTNLVALLVGNANNSAGVTGFIPLENLALDLIAGAVGGAQEVIDAILATVGFPAGSGTATQVNTYFADLLQMLANPALTSGTFNPVTAVENFITAMLAPTNMLAPMANVGGSYVVQALHIGALDASKVASGTFADSFVPGLANLQNTIISSQGGSGTGLAGVTTALQNIVINNVTGLTGYLTHLSPAGILALVGLAPGALPSGITLAGAQLTGSVAAAIVSGALTSATIAGSAITSVVNQANIPALTTAWTGTLDGSKIVGSITASIITGVLNQAQIPSLTAAWAGTIDGSVLRNAITTATLAGSQLSSAITNQNYIPALTAAWTGTIDGALLRNAITTATLAGSQLSSAITNQNYIPSLTSAWTGTIAGQLVSGALANATLAGSAITSVINQVNIPSLTSAWTGTIAGQLVSGALANATLAGSALTGSVAAGIVSGALTAATIAGPAVTGLLGTAQIPSLPLGWGKTIDGSLLVGSIAASLISGTIAAVQLPNIPAGPGPGQSADLQTVIDGIYQAIHGGTTTGNLPSTVKTALLNIPGANIVSSIAAALVTGALSNATLAGSAISSVIAQANIPSLTGTWGGTIAGQLVSGALANATLAGSAITSVIAQTNIPTLTSAWTGTIDGSVLRNAITTATLAGSQLSSAITNQAYIPSLTSAWTGTVDGSLLRNAITTATLAGSQLSSAITNQNYIPSLTATWTNSIAAAVIPPLDATKITTGVFGTAQIPGLPAGWGKTIDGSLLVGSIAASIITGVLNQAQIPSLTAAWTGTIDGSVLRNAITTATLAGSQLSSAITNQAYIPALTSAWTGTIDGAVLRNAITTATLAGSQLSSAITNQNFIPSLTAAWTGSIAAAVIPSLPSSWAGTIDGSVLRNAITTATLAGSQLSSAITNQAYIPSLTAAWTGTIDGSLLRNAITTATLAGSQLSSAITNQNYIPALSSAWTGTLDGSRLIGAIASSLIPNIPAGSGPGKSADLQTVVDNIYQASFGGTSTGNPAASVLTSLQKIPNANVVGLLGATGLGQALQDHVDAGLAGVAAGLGAGNSLATWTNTLSSALGTYLGFNFSNSTAPPPGSIGSISQTTQQVVVNQGVTKPGWQNVDPSMDAVFTLSSVMTNSTLPTNPLTQGVSQIGMVPMPHGGIKQTIAWLGYPTGASLANIQGFYVNVYLMNTAPAGVTGTQQIIAYTGSTGSFTLTFGGQTTPAIPYGADPSAVSRALAALSTIGPGNVRVGSAAGMYLVTFIGTLGGAPQATMTAAGSGGLTVTVSAPAPGAQTAVYATPNLIGSAQPPAASAAPVWNFYSLPLGSYITAAQGDMYGIEVLIFGTGTYNVLGVTNFLPAHPSVNPAKYGAARTVAAFDAAAAATPILNSAPRNGTGTFTWTQTIAANATMAVAFTGMAYNSGTVPTFTLSCGSTAMTATTNMVPTNGPGYQSRIWVLVDSPGTPLPKGLVTFTLTQTNSATVGWFGTANSASYIGPNSYGTVLTGQGVSANFTLTPASWPSANGFYVGGAATWGSTMTLVGNCTPRIGSSNVASTYPTVMSDTMAFPTNGSVGATRTSGDTVIHMLPVTCNTTPTSGSAAAAVSYVNPTPWLGMSGVASLTQYPPVLIAVGASGSIPNPATTYPWANFFDILCCGAGAGGDAGGPLQGSQGGNPGAWGSATITKAQAGSSAWSAVVSAGGTGGASTSAGGGAGGNTTVTVTGYGTVTGNGGAGHGSAVATGSPNAGRGTNAATLTFTDHYGLTQTYAGGAGGGSGQAAGGQPGGGGAGGNAVTFGTYIFGGVGGPGIVYIRAYQ